MRFQQLGTGNQGINLEAIARAEFIPAKKEEGKPEVEAKLTLSFIGETTKAEYKGKDAILIWDGLVIRRA